MNNLTVLDFGDKGIRFERRGDRVWVSLTDMAKASGKLVADWNRLGGAIEYLTRLESVMGIPITDSNQGGIPEKQGTWAIEQVAIKFAMWCNVDFEIWVTEQIKTLMTEGKVSIVQNPIVETEQPKIGSSVKATVEVLSDLRGAFSTVNPSLIDGYILNRIQARHPELKPEIDAGHALLAATNPIPELLLNPTDIGNRVGLGVRKVNKLLVDHGYQVKNVNKSSKTQPDYLPAEKGKPFSNFTLATGKATDTYVDDSSYQHLKWKESIVEVVKSLM